LEEALEVVDIRRLFLPDQWALAGLAAPLVDQVSEVASEVVSMVAEAVVDSGEASQIVGGMAGVDEEALATKVVAVSVAQTDTERHRMPQLDQEAHAPAVLAVLAVLVVVATAAGVVGMEALDHRIATVVVGMTREVAVAHMMTDPADIAAAAVEGMGTVTHLLEV
jgi:hypothetical protein